MQIYCITCKSLTCTLPQIIFKTGFHIVQGRQYNAAVHVMPAVQI